MRVTNAFPIRPLTTPSRALRRRLPRLRVTEDTCSLSAMNHDANSNVPENYSVILLLQVTAGQTAATAQTVPDTPPADTATIFRIRPTAAGGCPAS